MHLLKRIDTIPSLNWKDPSDEVPLIVSNRLHYNIMNYNTIYSLRHGESKCPQDRGILVDLCLLLQLKCREILLQTLGEIRDIIAKHGQSYSDAVKAGGAGTCPP